MLFNKIFVENDLAQSESVKNILSRFPNSQPKYIDDYSEVFNKVKKPYLQKRENLNLFLARKKGTLVKQAPDAYGVKDQDHYYFIHAYNCIYECEYCYLQGYFNSPDIVLFINYDEIAEEIKNIANNAKDSGNNKVQWFHAGEFSDSLALSHITNECEFYWKLFSELQDAKLELRTKSANIKEILKQKPLENIITSFSLSPEQQIKNFDRKTATLNQRLKAISTLQEKGYPVGLHIDPIVFNNNFENEFIEFTELLKSKINLEKIEYISLGVVRFTKDVYYQLSKNYPDSHLLDEEFIKSFDNKIRYSKPHRLWVLKKAKSLLLKSGAKEDGIYFCME